jgi:hypothetical protein
MLGRQVGGPNDHNVCSSGPLTRREKSTEEQASSRLTSFAEGSEYTTVNFAPEQMLSSAHLSTG